MLSEAARLSLRGRDACCVAWGPVTRPQDGLSPRGNPLGSVPLDFPKMSCQTQARGVCRLHTR